MLGMKTSTQLGLWGLLLVGLLAMSACDVINPPPPPAPIYVTATRPPQFLIVTNTPTPSPSPVLAPTLPDEAQNSPSEVSVLSSPELNNAIMTSEPAQITLTPTFTPTPTDTPATPGVGFGPVGGVAVGGVASCPTPPQGNFASILDTNPELAALIGCPLGSGFPTNVSSAYQSYERGLMLWISALGEGGPSAIYAVYNNGTYQRFSDTWNEGQDPHSGGAEPPSGLIEPIRGFGKVWRESAGVRDALGWARTDEQGGGATVQIFERGEMVAVSQNGLIYVLISGQPGTWTSFPGSF